MPIDLTIAERNRVQTERLRALTKLLTPKTLTLRLSNGWTVAIALAHIAFWDRQRLCLMQRWGAGDWCKGDYDGDLLNEVLLPFLKLLPTDRVASLAVEMAEQVDAILITSSDELIKVALARPDRPNVDRASHRRYHLDQIEKALAAQENTELTLGENA